MPQPNSMRILFYADFATNDAPVWRAECDGHQWAVADSSIEAVAALVREHKREHPYVHRRLTDDTPITDD